MTDGEGRTRHIPGVSYVNGRVYDGTSTQLPPWLPL